MQRLFLFVCVIFFACHQRRLVQDGGRLCKLCPTSGEDYNSDGEYQEGDSNGRDNGCWDGVLAGINNQVDARGGKRGRRWIGEAG